MALRKKERNELIEHVMNRGRWSPAVPPEKRVFGKREKVDNSQVDYFLDLFITSQAECWRLDERLGYQNSERVKNMFKSSIAEQGAPVDVRLRNEHIYLVRNDFEAGK